MEPPRLEEFSSAEPMTDALRRTDSIYVENEILVRPADLDSVVETGWGSFRDVATYDKLVEALKDCVSQKEQYSKMADIKQLAKKIEEQVHMQATKQEDYYHLLAEKVGRARPPWLRVAHL